MMKYCLLATALLISVASADLSGKIIFADDSTNEYREMGTTSKVGMILGFSVVGIFFIYTMVMMAIDEVQRHKDYSKKLVENEQEMRELEINIEEVKNKFYTIYYQKGGEKKGSSSIVQIAVDKYKKGR